MTTDRETLQRITVWMEEGRTRLPDHLLDAVLEELPSKPQRRAWGPARRVSDMSAFAKFAIAAAAVVVVALVGYNLLGPPTQNNGGVPPTAPPSSSPVPLQPGTGDIVPAGRYRWATSNAEVTFDLTDGWSGYEGGIAKNEDSPTEVGFGPNLPGSGSEVTHVYTDACLSEGALEPIGGTAEELVAALDAQKSTDAVISEVTAGSALGQRVEINVTPGLDPTTCRYGATSPIPLQIWGRPDETGVFAIPPEARAVVYVFDVDGEPYVFSTAFGSDASAADVDAIDAIVESMEFSKP